MTIPNFQAGQILTADGLNSALEDTASQSLSDVQSNPNTFTEPQTFAGVVNQTPGAGANNETPFAQYGDFLSDFIVEGLSVAVPSPASLTATLSAGTAVVLGQRTVVDSIPNATNTYAASSDTYVSLSQSGVVTYTAVSSGATAPAPASDAINILKVVTGPIISPTPTLSAGTSGTLAAGTYQVALVAYDATGYGAVSASESVTVAASGSIGISWTNPLNETSMSIYVTAEGGTTLGLVESGVTGTSYTYTGSVAPGAAAPSGATSNAVQHVLTLVALSLTNTPKVKLSDWGGDPTGNLYSDAAFYSLNEFATKNGFVIDLGSGTYKFSEYGLNLTTHMKGDGSTVCTLKFPISTSNNYVTTNGPTNLLLGGFSVVGENPIKGNTGLYVTQPLGACNIFDITITGAYDGFCQPGQTFGGDITGVNCNSNLGIGFQIDAPNITVTKCYCLENGSYGFYFTSVSGEGANIVLDSCTSFGNPAANLVLQGNSTHGIYDSLITGFTGSFSSSGHCVLIDTYGNANTINGIYAEYAGGSAPGSYTPYDGIHITANNTGTILTGATSRFNSGNGLYVNCSDLQVNASAFNENAFSSSGSGTGITIDTENATFINLTNVNVSHQYNNAVNGIIINSTEASSCSILGGATQNGVTFANGTEYGFNILGLSGFNQNILVNDLVLSGSSLSCVFAQISSTNNSATSFFIDGTNSDYGALINLTGKGAVTPTKYIQVNNGFLQILNSAYSGVIFSMDDEGNIRTAGAISITNSSTLTGTTAGTIVSSMPEQGVAKKFMAYANAYENDTTTAQTITFPTAFNNTPVITTNTSGLTLTVSTTELTLTAPDNTTAYSGLIIVEGF